MIANFKKKQKKIYSGNIIFSIAGGFVILIIISLLVVADFKINRKKAQLDYEVLSLKNQIEQVTKKNNELKQGIDKADSDEYLEKIAREQLDLQKPGEKVVTFVMPEEEKIEEKNPQQNIFDFKIFTSWLTSGWQWILNKF